MRESKATYQDESGKLIEAIKLKEIAPPVQGVTKIQVINEDGTIHSETTSENYIHPGFYQALRNTYLRKISDYIGATPTNASGTRILYNSSPYGEISSESLMNMMVLGYSRTPENPDTDHTMYEADIVGVSELFVVTPNSGGTKAGNMNLAESTYSNGKYTIVVDFPTNSANGQFNTVYLTNSYIFGAMNSSLVGYHAPKKDNYTFSRSKSTFSSTQITSLSSSTDLARRNNGDYSPDINSSQPYNVHWESGYVSMLLRSSSSSNLPFILVMLKIEPNAKKNQPTTLTYLSDISTGNSIAMCILAHTSSTVDLMEYNGSGSASSGYVPNWKIQRMSLQTGVFTDICTLQKPLNLSSTNYLKGGKKVGNYLYACAPILRGGQHYLQLLKYNYSTGELLQQTELTGYSSSDASGNPLNLRYDPSISSIVVRMHNRGWVYHIPTDSVYESTIGEYEVVHTSMPVNSLNGYCYSLYAFYNQSSQQVDIRLTRLTHTHFSAKNRLPATITKNNTQTMKVTYELTIDVD